MANITAYTPIDMPNEQVSYGRLISATSTNITVTNGYYTSSYIGSGFTYSGSNLVGGTLIGYTFSHSGMFDFTVSGLSVSASLAYSYIQSNNLQPLFSIALAGNDSFDLSSGSDIAIGYGGNDTMNGRGGDDSLYGEDGNDSLFGGSGNDFLDGGSGFDTAVFTGNGSGYTVFMNGGMPSGISGPDGRDALADVEALHFNNGTLVFEGDPLVDPFFYAANSPDVYAAGIGPRAHYNSFGWHEGRDPNAFFDTSWYLATNSDVRASGVNPLTQYQTVGWREGRDPGPNFDTKFYLMHNPDVAAAGIDPLQHYLQFGRAEGRAIHSAIGTPVNGFDACIIWSTTRMSRRRASTRWHTSTITAGRKVAIQTPSSTPRAISRTTPTWRPQVPIRSRTTKTSAGRKAVIRPRISTQPAISPPTQTWLRPASIRSTTI